MKLKNSYKERKLFNVRISNWKIEIHALLTHTARLEYSKAREILHLKLINNRKEKIREFLTGPK